MPERSLHLVPVSVASSPAPAQAEVAARSAPDPVWLVAGRMIVDRDPRPAMVIDGAGRICVVNRRLLESPGRPAGELEGQRWVDAWPADSDGKARIAEAVARAHADQ